MPLLLQRDWLIDVLFELGDPLLALRERPSASVRFQAVGSYQNDLLDEMVSFPNGKFKDQVDACSGAFNRLISGPVYNLWGGALD